MLVTFLLYLQRFFDPLQDLSQFYNTFQSAAAALEKISGVLDEAPGGGRAAGPGGAARRPRARPRGAETGTVRRRSGSATGRRRCCRAWT